MSTKFVALLAPKLAVTRKPSAGSQKPATDSDMLTFSITYIALTSLFRFQSGFTQIRAINSYLCCLLACALVFEELASSFLLAGISPLLAKSLWNKPCSYSHQLDYTTAQSFAL